jgi:hypothetical protein
MPETAVGEDRRDFETAEVDQCWSVVAGMGQLCSAVGVRVEQGRQHNDCHVSTQYRNAYYRNA